jgi:two-component system, NtrC family, sensor histidine kinase PilS
MIERIELVVQDDGPGIDRATRTNLFEPFFTTHHRGTGLGLYLARELCLANDARLDYSTNAGGTRRGGFVIRVTGTTA